MTHEYTIATGGRVRLPGATGASPATAIAWAGGFVIATGTDTEVRSISRGDSTFLDLGGRPRDGAGGGIVLIGHASTPPRPSASVMQRTWPSGLTARRRRTPRDRAGRPFHGGDPLRGPFGPPSEPAHAPCTSDPTSGSMGRTRTSTQEPPWTSTASLASRCCSALRRSSRCGGCRPTWAGEVEIWAKREDCNSGLAFGGNKVRKLEYLAADALAQGADTLVSIGGVQSNHTRAGRGGRRAPGDARRPGPGALGRMAGCRLRQGRQHPAVADHGRRRAPGRARASTSASGPAGSRRSSRCGRPAARRMPIPAGASDHPLGGLGFASWAMEVERQEAGAGHLLRHRSWSARSRGPPRRA